MTRKLIWGAHFFLLLNGKRAFHALRAMVSDGTIVREISDFIGDKLNGVALPAVDAFRSDLVTIHDKIVETAVVPEDNFHARSFF